MKNNLTQTSMELLFELINTLKESKFYEYADPISLEELFLISKKQSLGKAILHFEKVYENAEDKFTKLSCRTTLDDIFVNNDFEDSNLGKAQFFVQTEDSNNQWLLHSKGGGLNGEFSKMDRKLDWEQISSGISITIDRTTTIQFSFYKIEGIVVGFYTPCSSVVDYNAVDSWIKEVLFSDRLSYQNQHTEDFRDFYRYLKDLNSASVVTD